MGAYGIAVFGHFFFFFFFWYFGNVPVAVQY